MVGQLVASFGPSAAAVGIVVAAASYVAAERSIPWGFGTSFVSSAPADIAAFASAFVQNVTVETCGEGVGSWETSGCLEGRDSSACAGNEAFLGA